MAYKPTNPDLVTAAIKRWMVGNQTDADMALLRKQKLIAYAHGSWSLAPKAFPIRDEIDRASQASTKPTKPKTIKPVEPKHVLAIRGVEFVQSAVDGGHPLGNAVAEDLDLGHGSPLLLVSERDLVDYLRHVKGCLAQNNPTAAAMVLEDTEAMLAEWDKFVF